MSKENLSDTAGECNWFFTRVFGKSSGESLINIWSVPAKGSGRFMRVCDTGLAASIVTRLDAAGEDVYFGVCPHVHKPLQGRGSSETVACVPALWADIDLKDNSAHEASNLPPDGATVRQILTAANVPEPTLVVHSGHGQHLYWVLKEPASPEEGARLVYGLQNTLACAAKKLGYHTDMTADLARVLRVPGTRNFKTKQPKPVRVLVDAGQDYEATEFAKFAGNVPPKAIKRRFNVADPGPDPKLAIPIHIVRFKLQRLSNPTHRRAIAKLLCGQSFAERGDRDQTLQAIASTVAYLAPHNDVDQLAEIFRPSVTAWANEPEPDKVRLTVDEEMEKVRDKLERAQADKRIADAELAALLVGMGGGK